MAEIIKLTNISAFCKERMVSFLREKPVINILINTVSKEFQEVVDNMYKLYEERWINKAVGKHLDNLGEIVGEPRKATFINDEEFFKFDSNVGLDVGKLFFSYDTRSANTVSLSDEIYRTAIRAKILINQRSGTYQDIYDLLYALTESSNIQIIDVYPASVRINIAVEVDPLRKKFIEEKVKQALPIGVSLDSLNLGSFYFNDDGDGIGFDEGVLW